MKKIGYVAFLGLCILVVSSCEKDATGITRQVVIDTTLSAGADFSLDLSKYGDADDVAAMLLQPTHFSTSELLAGGGAFHTVYHYASGGNAKNPLTDKVMLSVTEGNANRQNCKHHLDSTIVTINFTLK